MSTMLVVESLTKRFGGLVANQNISFGLDKGELIGLIGPNGAGKTTLFNCIACFYNCNSGKIFFKGTDISRVRPKRSAGWELAALSR